MATLYDKQDELVAFLEGVVNAVEPTVKSSTRYRDTLRHADNMALKSLVGRPVNYLEVLYQGPNEVLEQTHLEQPEHMAHPFRVSYFYKYEDSDANEALWRSLTYADGGIVPEVNDTAYIGSGNTRVHLGPVEGDVMDIGNYWGEKIQHMLTFQVRVT